MESAAERVYERRLSGEESDEKFIFITKDALRKFPPLDSKFNLEFEGEGYESTIVAVSCDCIGTWHEHCHLKPAGLFEKIGFKKGTRITVSKIDNGTYRLEAKP